MTGCAILDSGIVARKNGKRLPCEVLEAENAKLREQVSMWRACREDEAKRCDRADAEVERLSAENDKLRELCGRALVVLENNCGECAYFYDCDILTDCKCVAPMKIRDELRELGVEVPE